METMMIGGGFGGLFWIVILLLVVWWISDSRSRTSRSTEQPQKSALDILNESYARGDLDRESYLLRRADINGVDE